MLFKNFSHILYEIEISYTTEWNNVNLATIKQALDAVIEVLSIDQKVSFFTLSVLLTTDEEVRFYNKSYRNKDKPTNILSFQGYENIDEFYDKLDAQKQLSLKEDDIEHSNEQKEPLHLGDLILGYETIQKELIDLQDKDTCFDAYFFNLCVHGLLHLFDIHHENDEEELRMNNLAKACAKSVGIELIM